MGGLVQFLLEKKNNLENHLKLVLYIFKYWYFGIVYHVFFVCVYVVSHYDLSVLSMSVMGLQKKVTWLFCVYVTHRVVVFEGYDVERCEDGSSFWEAVPGLVNGTSHVVKGLVDGTKYKFRVKAQNIYGTSEPVTTDKTTLAKNPFGELLVFCRIIK